MDPHGEFLENVFTTDHLQYKKIFESNLEFIEEKTREDRDYFKKLAKG